MCGRHVRKTERRSARFCSIPSPKKAAYLQATSHMIIIGRGLWKPQGPHRLLTVRCPSDRSTVAPRGRASSKARRSCAGAWRWHSELVARSRAAGAPRRRARRANRRRRALCRGRPGDQHYPRVRERLESVPGVVRALPARQHASAGRRYRPICHLARQTRSGRLHDPPPRCCDRPRPPPGRPPTRHQRPSRPHRARGDRPRPRLSPEQEDRAATRSAARADRPHRHSNPAGLRDRALLLLGFAVGLRRSELVALTVEDLSPFP
jgi:integrase